MTGPPSSPPDDGGPYAAASDPIAAFYEAHPYPPPVEDLEADRAAWADGRRRRIEHHRASPELPFREDHRILVAGCGTAQAARHAIRNPGSTVVGVDVSRTGIEHHRRLSESHGLSNLEVRRCAVEDVGSLGSDFDRIVCTGVLHHLADPTAGLRALTGVLAPGGALTLMVYAPYGRTGVYMLQEYARRLGVSTDPGEIRDLVATLRELPTAHPLGHLLRNTRDFQDDDALADALLNPRDRSYTVPEVFELLDDAGLAFGRWVRQAPYLPLTGVLAGLPHGPRIAALPAQEQYAALELFRGTMTRHSLICRRDEVAPPSFDEPDGGGLVPVRTATATVVREGVPAGAAAALLNRAHEYPDLVLLVSEDDARLFEAVDGRSTISELGGDPAFFAALFRRDLIVVDTSSSIG